MSRLDCEQALAHLQDYLKQELTPELVAGGAGPSGALPGLRRLCPLRGELPADAGDPGAAGNLPQRVARAHSCRAAGGGGRQLTPVPLAAGGSGFRRRRSRRLAGSAR